MRTNYSALLALCLGGILLISAGCASDPNVEGAKLNLRNGNFDKALDNVAIALENNPENAAAWNLKGDIHQKQLQNATSLAERDSIFEEMIAAYENARDYGASDVTQKLRVAWVNEMQAGGAAFKQIQSSQDTAATNQAADQAVHHFENATELMPDSTNGWVNLGYAHLTAGNQAEAIDPLQRALDEGATGTDIYTFLGQLYRRQEQFDQAIEVLSQGREQHPDNSDILNQLLNTYVAAERYSDARQMFARAVEENPDDPIYRYNYGSLLLQQAQQTAGANVQMFDRAIEQLQSAVDDSTNYADALYNLGAAIQNKGVAYNDSVAVLDDSLRNNEDTLSDSEIQDLNQEIKALMNLRRQAFEDAIPHLTKARRLKEQNNEDATEVCRALFQAYAQTNQSAEAKEAAACAGIDVN